MLNEPVPRVMQRTLPDFYVEYQSLFLIANPANRNVVLPDLHSAIQDVFSEQGVQIILPHYENQPERPGLVPQRQDSRSICWVGVR